MKVLDVESLQAGIAETMADIETKHTQIEAVQRAVRDFHSLDGALEGQGGDAIRGFYKDTHEPFLIHLHQSLTNYKQALKATSEAIHSFESDSEGYVSQEFLLNDVKEGYDQAGKTAKALTDEANQIINSVQDIVSIKEIDETEMMDSVSKGKEQVDTISEEFIEVDNEGASRLEETQDDLKTMQTFLSEMSTKFDSSASISNYSGASIRDMTSIKTIRDGVYSEDRTVSAMYGDKLEGMSIKEIEKGKNETLNHLGKAGQTKLNQAFIDLEKGRINRTEYANILQGELATSIEQGQMSDEARANLWEYLDEKKDEIGIDFTKDAGVTGVQQGGLALLRASIKKSDDAIIMKGPKGPTQWAIVDKDKVDKAGKYNKAGKALKFTGKFGGPALSVFGLNQGYKNDIEGGKTPGEAVSHTGGSFIAGFGGSGLATLAMTGSFFGPVGWVGAGVALVVGGGATLGFNALYDNNEKFRAGVDWTGNKLDEGVDWAENKAEDIAQWTVDKIANSSVYKKIASEVTDVKQKAGEAVNQVINETVNLGKEKLNDVKKRAGEALKEKIFGPKTPKINWGWN